MQGQVDGRVDTTELDKPSTLVRPLELIKQFPGETFAASDRLQWTGLEALRYRNQPPNEAIQPPLTHHSLLLLLHAPKDFEAHYEEVRRRAPPPAGSILLVPAGSSARWRWSRHSDSLHVFLEPGLVGRVAAEACELDPARVSLPPLDGLDIPALRTAMLAVNEELTAGAAGDRLAAESLANLLAIHLIRNLASHRVPPLRTQGTLPQRKLRAVTDFVEAHLAGLSLEQMAAAAHLSPFHFARQFKAATGLPPHQYVLTRRVERAKQLLQFDSNFSLAEVAASAGFSDQSQFTHHFKRLVGVTPGQFRLRLRTA